MENEFKWSVDKSHSEINFRVRHLMIAHVNGVFKNFDASVYTIGRDFTTANVDLWIDVSSISTGDVERDEHLRGADFFDVQNHDQIAFVSGTIEKTGSDDNFELWGDLTMKGVTRNVKLDVSFGGIQKDPSGQEKAGFAVTGKIKRSDWGLAWNTTLDSGGMMVADEISISCELELINAGEKAGEMVLEATSADSIV